MVSGYIFAAKHCYGMALGTMFHSLEHILDHYDMVEVEVGDPFRVDCTSILYIKRFLVPPMAVGSHKDVTPRCCSYQ